MRSATGAVILPGMHLAMLVDPLGVLVAVTFVIAVEGVARRRRSG